MSNAEASLDDLARAGNTSIEMLVGSYMKKKEKDGLALNKRIFKNIKDRKIQKNSIHLKAYTLIKLLINIIYRKGTEKQNAPINLQIYLDQV